MEIKANSAFKLSMTWSCGWAWQKFKKTYTRYKHANQKKYPTTSNWTKPRWDARTPTRETKRIRPKEKAENSLNFSYLKRNKNERYQEEIGDDGLIKRAFTNWNKLKPPCILQANCLVLNYKQNSWHQESFKNLMTSVTKQKQATPNFATHALKKKTASYTNSLSAPQSEN